MYPEAAKQDARYASANMAKNQTLSSRQILGGEGLMEALQVKQTKEVQARIDRLNHTIDSLSNTALRLVDRLSPVLGPFMPQPGTESAPASDLTTIGSQLSELTSRVHMIGNTLSDALDRLEL